MVSAENIQSGAEVDMATIAAKYEEERLKRFREEGSSQYVELRDPNSDKLHQIGQDPWADHDALNSLDPNLKDGDSIKVLILGTGWGGLLTGMRLVEAGIDPNDLRLVDVAGGFGGTWYWNRYPGIMCDVESSVYMPLLEETGYVPKHRFSYGEELREQANRIAKQWNLTDKAVFRTAVNNYEWDEQSRRWIVSLTQYRGPNEPAVNMTIKSQFAILCNGIFNHPKAPRIPGIETFEGDLMHTSRWNYGLTGGSSSDPTLSNLKDKRVAIIGTGATSIQAVPHLAKWSKQLYVFQRTASTVDERGQCVNDPESWQKMTAKKGWWKERADNWVKAVAGYPESEITSKVRDGWCDIDGYKHVVGGPHAVPWTPDNIPGLVANSVRVDIPRMERMRKRVDDVVKDKETAQNLKGWYPAWCKRPGFHDDYLQTFNLPNVTLVDTIGKGVEKIENKSLFFNGKEYEVDVLILGTGFRALSTDFGDPSKKSNTPVMGRGKTMSEKWKAAGARTLHGVIINSFPNFFVMGGAQAGTSPNFSHVLNIHATHVAYMLTEALKRAESPETVTIEPTVEAEEAWAMNMLMGAGWFAPLGACGPNYMNGEGEKLSPEDQIKAAYGVPYPQGILAYEEVVQKWRADGKMEGIVIKS